MEKLVDPQFVVMVLTGAAAFFSVLALVSPLLNGNKLGSRMKYVASEREKLRASRLAELSRSSGGLRQKPKSFMKQVVDRFGTEGLFDAEDARRKLKMAGFRGQAPLVAFTFFRLVMPPLVGVGAYIYLNFINNLGYEEPVARLGMALGAAIAGFYFPNLFVQNVIQKRQKSIRRAFPDALDLLLICVQSGLSIEASFGKVAKEVGSQSIELAEELTLTTAEMSYLQDRRQAYENLAARTGLDGVKAVATSLTQAERYGTPLSQALRVLAQENRDERMAEAEKKAAALPPQLTVPMILFFLPVLFIVILGPAYMQVTKVMMP